jgi:hypothetical protein
MTKFSDVEDFLKDIEELEGTNYGLENNFDFLRRYSFVEFIKRYSEIYKEPSKDEYELVARINDFLKRRSNILFKERNVDVQENLFTIWKYVELPEGMAISMSFVGVEDRVDFMGEEKYQRLIDSGLVVCVYDREARSSRHYANSPY